MALTQMRICECGAYLHVYVPRAKLFEWLNEPGLWHEVDAREELFGQVEMARQMCKRTGATFVDLRERDTCPFCGAPLGIEEEMRRLMQKSLGVRRN